MRTTVDIDDPILREVKAIPTRMAYLRSATHSSLVAAPLTPEEAWRNVGALVG